MKHRRLFIPNRGEIVKRIVQSARRLGFAVFGMVPRGDLGLDYKQVLDGFVEFDEQEHNYFLDTSFIINLCKFFNCNFLHPGYGFLSESPKLSKACQENGIVFIGPSDTHLELCGNKEACKNSVKGFFNLIPSASLSDDLKSLEKWVQLHSPIIVKAQWGGGGRGMRKVYSPNELQIYLEQASKEAANFGVPAVFVEKLIEKARHVEFQVVKPKVKDAIILGTRDCTIQR
ncbi:MAG: hypothetical protein N2654_05870, partial [Deltaproteobacteria bacterium]|nr:hypothetical protein [Deltaproteobacteria bacterium]